MWKSHAFFAVLVVALLSLTLAGCTSRRGRRPAGPAPAPSGEESSPSRSGDETDGGSSSRDPDPSGGGSTGGFCPTVDASAMGCIDCLVDLLDSTTDVCGVNACPMTDPDACTQCALTGGTTDVCTCAYSFECESPDCEPSQVEDAFLCMIEYCPSCEAL